MTLSDASKRRSKCTFDLGAGKFIFREVFYHPENDMVDHLKMPELLLKGNDFSQMRQGIIARFGTRASFEFSDAPAGQCTQ